VQNIAIEIEKLHELSMVNRVNAFNQCVEYSRNEMGMEVSETERFEALLHLVREQDWFQIAEKPYPELPDTIKEFNAKERFNRIKITIY
jgi:hypothetical protein